VGLQLPLPGPAAEPLHFGPIWMGPEQSWLAQAPRHSISSAWGWDGWLAGKQPARSPSKQVLVSLESGPFFISSKHFLKFEGPNSKNMGNGSNWSLSIYWVI